MVSNGFRQYQKRWRLKNKARLHKYWKAYAQYHKEAESLRGRLYYRRRRSAVLRRLRLSYLRNKLIVRNRSIEWRRKNPLRAKFSARLGVIRRRCEDSTFSSYKHYGGRGIECLLTLKDIEFLWKRDKASLMKHPTIDRVDNDGHYSFRNCRFIELSENVKKMNLENRMRYCCLHGKGCKE